MSREYWQLILEDKLPSKEASLQRNIAITAQYASWYLEKPKVFKWAGMAAFVSNAVGLFITISDEGEWQLFKETNNAIFEDIGWIFLAYKEERFEEIEAILGFEYNTYFLLKGFQLIKRGEDLLNDNQDVAEEMINLGTALLARHEQYIVAQPYFKDYGPAIRALLFTMLGLIDFDGDPLRISKSVKVGFGDLVDLRRFKDFGKADARWEFVTAKLFPKWWETERSVESLAGLTKLAGKESAVSAQSMIGWGTKLLRSVTAGVSFITKWLHNQIEHVGDIVVGLLNTTGNFQAQSGKEQKQKSFGEVLLSLVLTILYAIFVLSITPLILITPGLVIVFVLLQGSKLRDWWHDKPRQNRQTLVRNLSVALASAAGIILLVLGCQFLSRMAPDIITNLNQPPAQLRSTFVSSQPVVQSRVGIPVQIDSYHTSPDRVDSVEIFMNDQRLGTTGVLDTEQADIFPGHLGSVQVRSRGSLEGSVFRPEASNTATTVTLVWEGYIPGTYDLTLVAKDKAGRLGRPIVQRIEVR